MDSKIKETLEKQLQLLSECSDNAFAKELPGITHAMVEIAAFLSESQERQVLNSLADDVLNHLQAARDRNEPVFRP